MNPNRIQKTELFRSMKLCQRYGSDQDIIETIQEMRQAVREGEDPEEVLYEEGFEPDYVFDLL